MRYRRWIVVSTIVIYVLTLALAVMWLLKVREVDVRVTEASSGSTVYAECNEKLEKMLLGSVAAQVVTASPIPVLIYKVKKEQLPPKTQPVVYPDLIPMV